MIENTCRLCKTELRDDRLRCPGCGAFNPNIGGQATGSDLSIALSDVVSADVNRIRTNLVDELFGITLGDDGKEKSRGIVRTSATILGGAPGAGKTTVALQLCDIIATPLGHESMLIAAEQAPEELKLTGTRLRLKNMSRIRIVPAMNGASLVQVINSRPSKPKMVVVDSLQALVGDDDAMQLEVCKVAKDFAVRIQAPFIIISHVTKADVIAGKLTLQHAVDTTITFFPDEESDLRIMNVIKNRYGRANIGAAFNMTETGLVPYEESEDED